MLRGYSGLCPLHVRSHVSLLPVRAATVEGPGRGNLSHVPGANPGCHQDLQVLADNPTNNYSTVSYCDSQSTQSVLSVAAFKNQDLKIFI